MQALNDYVVLKNDKEEMKTAGGIYIDAGSLSNKVSAEVLSVGEEVKNIEPGDTVVYNADKGYKTSITTENEKRDVIIVKKEDVMIVL